jgi:enoyl-[acyl-carrier protein] reductase II
MFLGDMKEGELEVGQVSSMMDQIMPAKQIVEEIIQEFNEVKNNLSKIML